MIISKDYTAYLIILLIIEVGLLVLCARAYSMAESEPKLKKRIFDFSLLILITSLVTTIMLFFNLL